MTKTRFALDARFRQLHIDLSICSHVPAATLQPSTSHRKPGSIEPAGDTTPAVFADRYRTARTNAERQQIIEWAEQELATLKRRQVPPTGGETEVARRKRILKETEGWTPEEVGQSTVRILPRTIRKWRTLEGRDTETGHRRDKMTDSEKRTEVLRLSTTGSLSQYEIAQLLGIHRYTVSRIVNNAKRQNAA